MSKQVKSGNCRKGVIPDCSNEFWKCEKAPAKETEKPPKKPKPGKPGPTSG